MSEIVFEEEVFSVCVFVFLISFKYTFLTLKLTHLTSCSFGVGGKFCMKSNFRIINELAMHLENETEQREPLAQISAAWEACS